MRRTSRTRLPLVTVIAVTLTALLATLAPSAQAAPVRWRDVVSRADVVKVFPALAREDLTRGVGNPSVSHPSPAGCTPTETRAKKVLWFGNRDNWAARKRGFYTALVQFRTVAEAKRLVTDMKRYVRACSHYQVGSVLTVRVRPAALPRLGDQRVAYRQVQEWSTDPGVQRSTIVYVREGKRVMAMRVMLPKTVPARDIARIARAGAAKMG
ncbi:hypothetical protein GUY44_20085 [Pimelobacter simplex]|uniref:Uncharacterized protein n=1 Tax=Nocardioides simplex TaxID=2045 RepID=A0A0A1DMQ7_NOCSI|nr:hypothetical protein [Pimelobacter simplex]AIY17838.1 hypothetical protein KR76_15630 [Pimelobacter simplex]MCG8152794.1 hypothetical protein [Pimelobacter simplex]GEB13459.1 hypothetical protein NSI01_17740 [Pimelobacter simplex]SFM73279.1 hypothetical protein SAMN05421671_3209 [Pimelobacter simplex]